MNTTSCGPAPTPSYGVRPAVARAHPGVSVNDITDERLIDELTGSSGFFGVPVEVSAS